MPERGYSSLQRQGWHVISQSIASGLEAARKDWFQMCVEFLQRIDGKAHKYSWVPKVKNCNLGGEADLALRGFQIYLSSGFVANHDYIFKDERRDFIDILCDKVCGAGVAKALKYVSRYRRVEDDTYAQLFRISSDIARYITESEKPLAETKAVAMAVPDFVAMNQAVVAHAFGDLETIKEIKKKIG